MSTPEERLARLEARQDGLEDWIKSMDAKLDRLLTAADMGKGAWVAILKLGGVLTVIAGALAWVWDHLPKVH